MKPVDLFLGLTLVSRNMYVYCMETAAMRRAAPEVELSEYFWFDVLVNGTVFKEVI